MNALQEAFQFIPPLNAQQIIRIIPHRHPFLLVDEVTEFGEDYVRGSRSLSISDPVFAGHFPGHPVYPGVLQIETMAQLGATWILARKENLGKIAYLMSVEAAKFRRPAYPGMKLDLFGRIVSYKTRTGRLEGEISADGKVISSATLIFAFQKEDQGKGSETGS